MYQIGEFSQLSKTTIKALRYYDKIGLLKPATIDAFTGYRFYTTDQLMETHKIKSLQQAGLSIEKIKQFQQGKGSAAILQRQKVALEEELSKIQEQLCRIDFLLQKKKEDLLMDYTAMVKELPKCIVYTKKFSIPNYDAYFKIIPPLGKQVMEKYPDLKCTTPEYCFIVYLDGEYKEKDFQIEFCEAVDQSKPNFDGIVFKEIPETICVSVMHRGSYDTISEAYAFAFRWIENNGYLAAEPPRENFIDGIWHQENPKDWLTELQIPIKKA